MMSELLTIAKKYHYTHFLFHFAVFCVVGFLFFGNAQLAHATAYFGKNGVSPTATTSWGTTAGVCTGAGSQPSNFITAGDTFTIESCATMTATATWTVGAAGTTASTLTINNGGTLAMSTFLLTLASTNFTNSGTYSGSGGVTISGTLVTNTIGGFTTTGTVSMTKTAGTATFTASGSTTGNVNGAGFTINGTGGTLNLGVSLTHTFTGNVALTAGTLNGGSSILNANGTTTSTWTGTGTNFTASTGTVAFGGTTQSISTTTTFNNLTVKTSGVKTIITATTTTVNGVLSMEGTATLTTAGTGALAYGASATLQYNTSTSRTTATTEWPATAELS